MARATDTLASRKSFLQQQHVEGRLAALTYKMNAIGEQKAAVEMANKVTRLVGMVASLASVLPDLVDRMELAGGVHEWAKQWVQFLDSTEQQQRETNKLLEDTEKMVKETRECFDTGLNRVADKFGDLQKRLQESSLKIPHPAIHYS